MADGDPGEWPDVAAESRAALDEPMPGWPGPDDPPVPPTAPVPAGRGGEQRIPRPYNARPGGPAPWAHLPAEHRRPTVADVRAALGRLGPAVPRRRGPVAGPATADRTSAVLAPIYDAVLGDGPGVGAHVVLTRRTWGMRTHRGEVSFPGGRVEDGETPVEGARREAEEEIALDPSLVEIVGELDSIATVSSGVEIVPFVGVLPGRPSTRPSPIEVEAVLHVSLAELADPANFREEIWSFPGGPDRPITFFELIGDTVWGATAALLRQLLGIVTGTLGRGDVHHP